MLHVYPISYLNKYKHLKLQLLSIITRHETVSSFRYEKLTLILCVGLCVRVFLRVFLEGVNLNSLVLPCLSRPFNIEIRWQVDRVCRSIQNA